MALKACGECGNEISTKAAACPKCGAKVPRFKWWLWTPVGLLGAFFLTGAILGSSPAAEERARARTTIERCWNGQDTKSLTPGAQRFVAGACEMLEKEFEEKYGVKP